MKNLLVVDETTHWQLQLPSVEVVSSTDYLTDPEYQGQRGVRVFNVCSSYNYQESGYYVSLLATARKHRVTPSVSTILEMKSAPVLRIRSQELDDLIQRTLRDIKSDEFTLSIYFGKNLSQKYRKLSAELHKVFHAPLVRARFARKDKWRLISLTPIGLKEVPDNHWDDLKVFAQEYFSRKIPAARVGAAKYSLAILVDPDESMPPSNERSIKKFVDAAEKRGIETEILSKEDIGRLAEFDALFIRVTTAVNHYTYRFAQRAQALGLAVVDDPASILACSNKVYMAELFSRHNIPAPRTTLAHLQNWQSRIEQVRLPAVLKKPDSSFSRGVVKVETFAELRTQAAKMLEESDLIVIQEFVPTEFDWRIGVIDGEALYACKYYMARNHWQIYKSGARGRLVDGKSVTLPIEQVPQKLVNLATKVAKLIGKGLYGLDVKEYQGKYYVIEINDNPSIDCGVEDKVLKDALYLRIMDYFVARMDARTRGDFDYP